VISGLRSARCAASTCGKTPRETADLSFRPDFRLTDVYGSVVKQLVEGRNQ